MLARVMDAFQVRMQGALLAASVKTLSESPSVARLMAAEPAAPQAGSPVAFFTGRHTDSVDAFVTDVLNNTGAAIGQRQRLNELAVHRFHSFTTSNTLSTADRPSECYLAYPSADHLVTDILQQWLCRLWQRG